MLPNLHIKTTSIKGPYFIGPQGGLYIQVSLHYASYVVCCHTPQVARDRTVKTWQFLEGLALGEDYNYGSGYPGGEGGGITMDLDTLEMRGGGITMDLDTLEVRGVGENYGSGYPGGEGREG